MHSKEERSVRTIPHQQHGLPPAHTREECVTLFGVAGRSRRAKHSRPLLLMASSPADGRMPQSRGRSPECLTPTPGSPLVDGILSRDHLSVGEMHSEGARSMRTLFHQKHGLPPAHTREECVTLFAVFSWRVRHSRQLLLVAHSPADGRMPYSTGRSTECLTPTPGVAFHGMRSAGQPECRGDAFRGRTSCTDHVPSEARHSACADSRGMRRPLRRGLMTRKRRHAPIGVCCLNEPSGKCREIVAG